jgi:hypothetical protein
MNTCPLIERLIEIERCIGVCDAATIRKMVVEAQDCALKMHKEFAESLRPMQGPDRT